MASYIEKEKAIKAIVEHPSKIAVFTEKAIKAIESLSTADVVEVKHGEWFVLDECANEGVYCSMCHKKVYKLHYANQALKSKFCPNCGARMITEEGKENDL